MIYLKLLLTFMKIGAFTFGGGYAMLPMIQEAVAANGWLTSEELVNFIAVSESTPGPFAINISTYIGFTTGGFFGALCASLGVVLPSFIIILIVAKIYDKFQKSKAVKGVMSGLKPAVVGLIGTAVLTTAISSFEIVNYTINFNLKFFISLIIFAIALFAIIKKKVHPIYVIIASAIIGIVVNNIFLL